MSADLGTKIKTALGETRLLILGAQILFGFHLNAAFQQGFTHVAPSLRALHAFAFVSMASAIGLLIAPSMQHRIVEGGHASTRILRVTTRFADWALLPFAVGLTIDLYIVVTYRFGARAGTGVAAGIGLLALLLWYGAEGVIRWHRGVKEEVMTAQQDTSLDERVEHMLTEARVLIPGAQALFGFQLAILLTESFGRLPALSQVTHLIALCCIAVTVVLLMAPAAFHRLAFGGENSEDFHRLGSAFVIASAAPLAIGIACDLYVAVALATQSTSLGTTAAAAAGLALFTLWFAAPLMLRASTNRKRRTRRHLA